jgi:hypothetical protein
MVLLSLLVLFSPGLRSAVVEYFDKMLLLYGHALLAAFGIVAMAATAVPDELMTSYLNAGGSTLAYNYAP